MEQIEVFFDFLKTHLKEDFKHRKFAYDIKYYEYYHNYGDLDYRSNSFRIPKHDGFEIKENRETGFYLVLETFGSGDYFGVYLNPTLQEILEERIYEIEGKPVIEANHTSLFSELDTLYSERCKEFYMDFAKYMQYISADNYSLKIKNILIRLKDFENQAKSPEYHVVSREYGSNYALLHTHLQKLVKRIIASFSLNISLEDPIPQIDSEESINLESKNLFNSIPIKKVKGFFEKFTLLQLSKDAETVLKSNQVDIFLKRAFIEPFTSETYREKLKMHFTPNRFNQKIIEYIFFKFYYIAKDKFSENRNTKRKYVKLLNDNFEGFDEDTIYDNFEKSPKLPSELKGLFDDFDIT